MQTQATMIIARGKRATTRSRIVEVAVFSQPLENGTATLLRPSALSHNRPRTF